MSPRCCALAALALTALSGLCIALVDVQLSRAILGWPGGLHESARSVTGAFDLVTGKSLSDALLPGALLAAALLARRARPARARLFVLTALSASIPHAVVGLLKPLLGRLRPYQIAESGWVDRFFAGGNSFPSGHTAFYWGIVLPLAWAFPRWRGWIVLPAVLVSLARVLEGDHFAGDVLAGLAITVLLSGALRVSWSAPWGTGSGEGISSPMTRRAAGRGRGRSEPESRLVTGIRPEPATPEDVARRFRALIETGVRLRPVGRRPAALYLSAPYRPRHEVRLFGARYFLGAYRFDDSVAYFPGFVRLGEERALWPRAFYKDSSLLWRVASHFVREEGSVWIGKGDVRVERRGQWTYWHSLEETTNLPYELTFALDELSRRDRQRRDARGLELFVREAPPGRIQPYADFLGPRRRAARRWREHGGRLVARFLRACAPSTLRFARGYEPDFRGGIVERGTSASAFFGGRIEKYRILSANRRVQYLFLASPGHIWIGPPQLLSTELSSYGVRVHDVAADEDLFVPGYEYHEDGHSQIPAGFSGAPHPDNPDRADASAWLEELPVVREFRARVLRGRGRARSR
jgi:membrane-associated phospholipid phosphatase